MAFYEFIKQCLIMEAKRTEPDSTKMLKKIKKEIEEWKKKK